MTVIGSKPARWQTLAFLLMILSSYPSLRYLLSRLYPRSGHHQNLHLVYDSTCMQPTLAHDSLLSFQCPPFHFLTPPLVLRCLNHWSHYLLLTLTKLYISFLPSLIRWFPIVTEYGFTFACILYSLTPLLLHCTHWMKP